MVEECQDIIEKRKTKLLEFKRSRKIEDFVEYKRIRAVARKIVKRKKREDLHRFAASLNKNIGMKYIWGKLSSLKKGWIIIDWKKWQIKDREEEIEKTIEKLAPPWVNNKKVSLKSSKEEDEEEEDSLNLLLERNWKGL